MSIAQSSGSQLHMAFVSFSFPSWGSPSDILPRLDGGQCLSPAPESPSETGRHGARSSSYVLQVLQAITQAALAHDRLRRLGNGRYMAIVIRSVV